MLSGFLLVQIFATLWTIGSSIHGILQEKILEWDPPGDLPDPGIEPTSLMSPELAGKLFTSRAT